MHLQRIKKKKKNERASQLAYSLIHLQCLQPPLSAVTGCKCAIGRRWTTPCDITVISKEHHMHVWVCLSRAARDFSFYMLSVQKEEKGFNTDWVHTRAAFRSSCSRLRPRCQQPQPGQGSQRGSNTSFVRTRSRKPRPAWGRAVCPPNTSRWMQPQSKSGGLRRWWSTPAEKETHKGVTHKGISWFSLISCEIWRNRFLNKAIGDFCHTRLWDIPLPSLRISLFII